MGKREGKVRRGEVRRLKGEGKGVEGGKGKRREEEKEGSLHHFTCSSPLFSRFGFLQICLYLQ